MTYRSLFAGALLTVTLAACSRPTSLQPTWHAAKGSVGPYAQVLVVGVTSNQNRRRQFEDLLAARLRENGNTAWASSRETSSMLSTFGRARVLRGESTTPVGSSLRKPSACRNL